MRGRGFGSSGTSPLTPNSPSSLRRQWRSRSSAPSPTPLSSSFRSKNPLDRPLDEKALNRAVTARPPLPSKHVRRSLSLMRPLRVNLPTAPSSTAAGTSTSCRFPLQDLRRPSTSIPRMSPRVRIRKRHLPHTQRRVHLHPRPQRFVLLPSVEYRFVAHRHQTLRRRNLTLRRRGEGLGLCWK